MFPIPFPVDGWKGYKHRAGPIDGCGAMGAAIAAGCGILFAVADGGVWIEGGCCGAYAAGVVAIIPTMQIREVEECRPHKG